MVEKKDTKKKMNPGIIAGIGVAAVAVICVIVAICVSGGDKKGGSDAKVAPIVGTWKYSGYLDYTYVFNADGTCSYAARTCTYKDNGDSIEILYDGDTDSTTSKYRIEGSTLYIEDFVGDEVKYEKQ